MKFVLSGILMFVFVYVGCEQQQSVTAPDLTSSGRQFVEMLAGGDYAKVFETFDAAMKDAMPVGQIDAAWQSLVAKVGAFQEIAGVRQAKEQNFDVVYVTCSFEQAQVDVKVVYDSKKEVSGLWFAPR